MVHVCSVINHSNGRTLFRKRRRRRRPSSPLKVAEEQDLSGGASLNFFHLYTFMVDVLYASESVAWFLVSNWIDLVLWACACLVCGLRFYMVLIREMLVCCIEILCSALAGRGSLLYFLLLLYLRDVSGASVWACLYQNFLSMEAVGDYVESGKLRRDLYKRTKLCIFKYNFICCAMTNDGNEGGSIRMESGSKRKKVTKASLGNVPMCRRRKGVSEADEPPPFSMTSSEVQLLLGHALQLCHCRKEEGAEGCLYQNCEGSI